MIEGTLTLPSLDGKVIDGVWLIGEPSIVDGKLRCLANCHGSLCVVELAIRIKDDDHRHAKEEI